MKILKKLALGDKTITKIKYSPHRPEASFTISATHITRATL